MLLLGECERFAPCVDGFQIAVPRINVTLIRTPFTFLRDAFDGVPIAVDFMLKLYVEFEQTSVEPRRTVDEQLGFFEIVFPSSS